VRDPTRLVYDGAPSKNLYGVDIANYWNVGFDMFQDKNSFDAKFIEADILSDNTAFASLKSRVDFVSVFQLLHQWNWNGQLEAAKTLANFTKPGSMIVGNQIGNQDAREYTIKPATTQVYRQNAESMEKLWNQVGEQTGTKWKTQVWMLSFEEMGWD
jgi:hypothetical protein